MSKSENKVGLFFKIVKECWISSITPFVMLLMMSVLLLVCQAITVPVLGEILSAVCFIGGFVYVVMLTFSVGKRHYDAFITGELHRNNALFGIQSGGNHQVEKEYRWYKGLVIGFFIALPVMVVVAISFAIPPMKGMGEVFLDMIAGWAIIPVQLIFNTAKTEFKLVMSIAMGIFPILAAEGGYLAGMMKQRKAKREENERAERVREIQAEAAKRK